MTLDICNLDCIHPESGEVFTVNLSEEDMQGKAWHVKMPPGEKGHEYIGCTQFHRGGRPQSQYQPDKDYLCVSMFVPTPGRSEMINGNHQISWELHPQQIDFLISYFDNLDKGIVTRPLVINFCDESPKLKDILPQIYSCMQLFDTPVEKVAISGLNFAGQRAVNVYAKRENVDPLKYVVMWNMTGHMDHVPMENRIRRVDEGKPNATYHFVDNKEEFWNLKAHTFTFLNRRYAPIRALALWSLYLQGIWKYKFMISAFPPLQFHKIGNEEHGILSYFTEDYFRSVLQSIGPTMRNELTTETHADFVKKFNIGKTVPGDHRFIGGIESKYAPNMESGYLWYTIETVADHKERNVFYTEKMLKPMLYGQGLIAYAQPGMIQKFKDMGFYTLAEELGFSEDYDNERDNEKRMKMISIEIAKLCEVPLLDMHERWLSAKDKIIHNQKMIACQLTNVRNNYWDNMCESTNEQLRAPYDAKKLMEKQTYDVIEEYQKLFKIEDIIDN